MPFPKPRELPHAGSTLVLAGLLILAILALLFYPGHAPQWLLLAVAGLSGILAVGLFRLLRGYFQDTSTALANDLDYIQRIADLSQDLHAIIDVETRRFTYMNTAVESFLGFEPEYFISRNLEAYQSLIHPEDKARLALPWQRLATVIPNASKEKESTQEELYRIKNRWDEYRWFRVREVIIKRDPKGRPLEALMVAHDITEERALEMLLAQAQEFESLGTLSRRLAHDLNNLLMGISGHVELGLENPSENSLPSHLREIGEIAERASSLCQQMLTYTGQGRVQPERHNINDAIRDGLTRLETLIPENIQISLEMSQDIPAADADPKQVRQALLSLVMHAVEDMGNREGVIRVSTSLTNICDQSPYASSGLRGDYICLEVEDNGPGMSEETLQGLFDPLYRAKHPGQGLGILTVQGIAGEHNGALHATSTLGKGSAFRLFLPVSRVRNPLHDPDEDITMVSSDTGAVLLIDDEPCVRAIIRQGLEHAGFQVLEASGGLEGIDHLKKQQNGIRMVLLDLTMPQLGGAEVFREIQNIAPDLPVVLMSGYTSNDALEGLQGISGFLAKPCSVREVIETVRRILGQRA